MTIVHADGEPADIDRPKKMPRFPRITVDQMDRLLGRTKSKDWVDEILAELSPEEIAELRREINDKFDETLAWYQLLH